MNGNSALFDSNILIYLSKKELQFKIFRSVRLHVRLCNTRKRKELSRKHEIPKTRKEYQQLDSIGISIFGHGLH